MWEELDSHLCWLSAPTNISICRRHDINFQMNCAFATCSHNSPKSCNYMVCTFLRSTATAAASIVITFRFNELYHQEWLAVGRRPRVQRHLKFDNFLKNTLERRRFPRVLMDSRKNRCTSGTLCRCRRTRLDFLCLRQAVLSSNANHIVLCASNCDHVLPHVLFQPFTLQFPQ